MSNTKQNNEKLEIILENVTTLKNSYLNSQKETTFILKEQMELIDQLRQQMSAIYEAHEEEINVLLSRIKTLEKEVFQMKYQQTQIH